MGSPGTGVGNIPLCLQIPSSEQPTNDVGQQPSTSRCNQVVISTAERYNASLAPRHRDLDCDFIGGGSVVLSSQRCKEEWIWFYSRAILFDFQQRDSHSGVEEFRGVTRPLSAGMNLKKSAPSASLQDECPRLSAACSADRSVCSMVPSLSGASTTACPARFGAREERTSGGTTRERT